MESLNAGFFQYNSFIHLNQGQSRAPRHETNQPVDVRISVADVADVTFEMSDIDRIEADLGRSQRVRCTCTLKNWHESNEVNARW